MSSTASTGPGPSEPELVIGSPVTTAVVRGVVPVAGLRAFYDASFRDLARATAEKRVPVLGPAFALFRTAVGDTLELEVGFPVERAVRADGVVGAGRLPGGRVARVTHRGSFDDLAGTWARLAAWIAEQGLTPAAQRWESYVTRPSPGMDPRELRTELHWPVGEG